MGRVPAPFHAGSLRDYIQTVCLRPDALSEVAFDPDLWRVTVSQLSSRRDLETYVGEALAEQHAGTGLPFATVLKATGQVIGSTRFGNAVSLHRRRNRLDLGGPALAALRSEPRGERSRTALTRLGAVEEGTLRHPMVNADGPLRDSVYFSILAEEWPAVRRRLEERLA